MKIRLDESRDSGVVSPPEGGACYFQDGLYFDNEGVCIEKMCDKAHLKKKRLEIAQAKAAEKAEAELGEPDDPEVDLGAWLNGEQKVRFALVQEAIKEQYGEEVKKTADARAFLLEVLTKPVDPDGNPPSGETPQPQQVSGSSVGDPRDPNVGSEAA